MSQGTPYRTLFLGELAQESALSLGGTAGEAFGVDEAFCRDGLDRPTLRGEALAGALIATARTLFDPNKLPESISAGFRGKGSGHPPESLWRLFSSHPRSVPASEPRSGVGLRQETAAPAAGVLFDVETLPPGTVWPFCLEVNTFRDPDGIAEKIAAWSLLEWTRGRLWIGRSPARGLGWMTLKNLQCFRLTGEEHHDELWPDSRFPIQDVLERIRQQVTPIDAKDFQAVLDLDSCPLLPPEERTQYLEITGTVECGFHEDGYGWDALSLGGHETNRSLMPWNAAHLCLPEGRDLQWIRSGDEGKAEPDSCIVYTQRSGSPPEPFVPGSSIRGTMRHALSRMKREQMTTVWDPNANPRPKNQDPDPVEETFGGLDGSSLILVQDAYLADAHYLLAWLQHHAEDEFTQGAYESAKFDSVALLQGKFHWKIVAQIHAWKPDMTPNDNMKILVNQCREQLQSVLRLACHGHLPLGGKQWSGMGWPKWTVTSAKKFTAGDNHGDELSEFLRLMPGEDPNHVQP
ncbi:MAG: hypothetical protein HPY51_09055 [Candidatus Omnitrophica bacterium]|nr:hypothetical protein [Candidatus Omnitrophota bacterium]